MLKDGYGIFGAQAVSYSKARQDFPREIFQYLKERAANRTKVLDVGCGTGIPSRQLVDYDFVVTGSDIDERMIGQAKVDSEEYKIDYVVAPANKLPFEDKSFEIVTAFSAFHWFCDKESVSEIKRVLDKDGLLFVVNKNETGELKKIIKNTLVNFIPNRKLPSDVKEKYDPTFIFEENRFKDIKEYVVPIVEKYTLEEAILYVQSMSIWNLVAKDNKGKALEKIKEAVSLNSKNGLILRPLEVRVVSGFK